MHKSAYDAVKIGDANALKRALQQQPNTSLVSTNSQGMAMIHVAAHIGSVDCLSILMRQGSNIELPVTGSGATPLIVACSEGQINAAKVLLDARANVNATDSKGATALHHAAFKSNHQLASVLIEKGASADIADYKLRTPLSICPPKSAIKTLLKQAAFGDDSNFQNRAGFDLNNLQMGYAPRHIQRAASGNWDQHRPHPDGLHRPHSMGDLGFKALKLGGGGGSPYQPQQQQYQQPYQQQYQPQSPQYQQLRSPPPPWPQNAADGYHHNHQPAAAAAAVNKPSNLVGTVLPGSEGGKFDMGQQVQAGRPSLRFLRYLADFPVKITNHANHEIYLAVMPDPDKKHLLGIGAKIEAVGAVGGDAQFGKLDVKGGAQKHLLRPGCTYDFYLPARKGLLTIARASTKNSNDIRVYISKHSIGCGFKISVIPAMITGNAQATMTLQDWETYGNPPGQKKKNKK